MVQNSEDVAGNENFMNEPHIAPGSNKMLFRGVHTDGLRSNEGIEDDQKIGEDPIGHGEFLQENNNT